MTGQYCWHINFYLTFIFPFSFWNFPRFRDCCTSVLAFIAGVQAAPVPVPAPRTPGITGLSSLAIFTVA
jgi:hypothetical protein